MYSKYDFWLFLVAPQPSPPQHSRLGSPGMDDNRSRLSPGLNDGQNGQSRNQMNEATEEVISPALTTI